MSDPAVTAQILSYLPPDRLRSILSGTPLPESARGSALFADISGFTPLTEAVVRRYGARRGGEELTDRLNAVYDALISEVDRRSGSVIGFAGDAIMCWFAGDDGLQAACCALAMRERMDQIREVRLPDGSTYSLGMKVAVAVGSVRRFPVGAPDIHLFDVISGRLLERVADAEHEAERGDVVLDESAADALESRLSIVRWKQRASDGRRYALIDGVVDPPAHNPWPPVDVQERDWDRLRSWLIPQIYRRLAGGEGDFLTELRPAAAVFVRFSGIDFEGDRAAAEKLDTYFCWVQGIVDRLEGIIVQLTTGDKGSFFYAAFGAPVAHDDDTRRALTAALEIVHPPPAIAEIAGAVQIGVTRGTMRTGAYGGKTRRTYGVLGDDVNLSARLMAKAGPNEILVSGHAARRQMDTFELLPLPPVTVKGKKDPIPVLRLVGRKQSGSLGSASAERHASPMIGRKRELALAVGQLRLAAGRLGQVIALAAEAGMGKTRLLTEVVREGRELGFAVFAGDCPVLAREASYAVWVPIWRSLFELSSEMEPQAVLAKLEQTLTSFDPELAARAPLLGPLLNVALPDNELTRTLDAKVRRASLEGLVVECLRHVSRSRPVLLILEECHWIDAASKHLLATVTKAVPRLSVAVLLTHRPVAAGELFDAEEEALEHVTKIELGDLPPDEARQLIELKLGSLCGDGCATRDQLVELIAVRASGNPFFIEEVVHLLESQHIDLNDPRAVEALELPTSVHSLILGRIDQLSEDAKTTLKVASVIGRLFRTAMLFGVHPIERSRSGLPGHLLEMRDRDVALPEPVDGDDAYLFKHIVIQEVAYESLPYSLRATIHEAIGAFIERIAGENQRPWIDLLAFHFGRSNRDDKKRQYFVAAGDAARAAYALTAAISYYERVLPFLAAGERIDILTRFGEVLELVGRWNDAFARYREARELAEQSGAPAQRAAVAAAIGDLHRKRGEFADAEAWLKRARQENAELGNELGVAQMLHLEGTLSAQSGNFTRAAELFQRALDIRDRLGDEANAAKSLNNLGIVARSRGDVETALRHYERSLEIRRRVGDRREIANSLNNLGFVHRYRGEFDRARELLEESVKMNRAVGDRWSTANALTSLAELALDTGDAALALRCLKESIAINRELGDKRALAYLLEGFGHLGRIKGQRETAILFFSAARSLRDAIGAPLEPADAEKLTGLLATIRGELDASAYERADAEGRALSLSTVLDCAGTAFG